MLRIALKTARRVLVAATLSVLPITAIADGSVAFKQALAESVAKDRAVATFYQERAYAPLWTGRDAASKKRREALIKAFQSAPAHALPADRYSPGGLQAMIRAAKSPTELGALEGRLSRIFLQYARDVQTGIVTPSKIDPEIARKIPYRGREATLAAFSKSSAQGFMNALPPKTPEYARLMKEKLRLERQIAKGGWGPQVNAKSLKPGASGPEVVALRNRLIAMGFLGRTNAATYDQAMVDAVKQFQLAHGLATDGVAGPGTMGEVNVTMQRRLTSVIVAMERERWVNRPLGARHVWVNLTDYSARIVDNGKVTFQTRSVVGANKEDRRSPEFSDIMEFMVINPSWYVPRSIATKEYLPLLQGNRNAVSHLEMRDNRGKVVSRTGVDFASYTEETFPFSFRQPPSRGNALGLVKFMFPNKYNIYLHDTPAKALFARETRAFSHGCIRLADPFDFAYELLRPQTANPEGFFQAKLATNTEARVNLKTPVPVHLVYRTAFTSPGGVLNFRRDLYGRDAKIWNALQREGVVLRAVQS